MADNKKFLVLTREVGQTLTIGEGSAHIDCTVTSVNGDNRHGVVRLAFDSAADVEVWRREVAADRLIADAVDIALEDGDDDDATVIDRMLRVLLGARYDDIVTHGIAP